MRLASREKLQAAFLLLERGLLRAAASRLYFSMFQAVVCALDARGGQPIPREGYWSHAAAGRLVAAVRGLASDAVLFADLRDMRITADYREEVLEGGALERVKHDVRRFVEEVTA